jgi:hypothetical protein
MPILTYGPKTWTQTKADIRKLMTADMRLVRSENAMREKINSYS